MLESAGAPLGVAPPSKDHLVSHKQTEIHPQVGSGGATEQTMDNLPAIYPLGSVSAVNCVSVAAAARSCLQEWFARLPLDLQFHKLCDTFLIQLGRFITLRVNHNPAY